MIVIIPLVPILIILLLFVLGIIGNASTIIDNIFFFISLISIILNIFICFIQTVSQEEKGFVPKMRKIVSSLFCAIMPIIIVGLFLQSNNFYSEMGNSFNGYTFVYKYQKAIVFPISALVGCLVNILILLINFGVRRLETKAKSISLYVNLLVVIIMLVLPVCGEKIVNNINLTRCNNSTYKEVCTVKKDDFVFQTIRTNYEKSVGNNSVISLPFLKYKVKKGICLFTTGKTFKKNGKIYIEVYDESIYGFIDEKYVAKKDSKLKNKEKTTKVGGDFENIISDKL